MNLKGMRAVQRRRRGWAQRVASGGGFDADKDERYTPAALLEWCARRAGVTRFDLDIAACAEAHVAERYFSKANSALGQPWCCDTFWGNIPFTSPFAWTAEAWRQAEAHEFRMGLVLLPAMRQEQPGWHRDIEPWRDRGQQRFGYCLDTHHPPGRWAFGAPGGVQLKSAGFPLVLLVWRRAAP